MTDQTAARHLKEELAQLKARLLAMGGLAEERVHAAMRALVAGDERALEEVVTGDEPLNQLQVEIDNRAFTVLALHQPLAVDLRVIVAAVKINTDLERVGDLAVNIAEASRRYVGLPPVKPLIDLPRMADIAQGMLRRRAGRVRAARRRPGAVGAQRATTSWTS